MLAALLLGWMAHGVPVDERFAREVEPVLRQACLECHGEKLAKGGLRLDTAEGLASAVKPGAPEQSELYLRLISPDKDERMPQKGEALSEDSIAAIARWIESGAHADLKSAAGEVSHWAYRAPRRHEPAVVKNAAWVRDPLDAFVLARLEQRGLQPAPPADLDTLLRRAALDLTGLPPPKEWLFQSPSDPERYYRQRVEELLCSPHCAERMALGWLDLARYADTHGYEKDDRRTLWPWRDWVIAAFAADMPYDQFTIEQLAGDLLPQATREQQIATGFHRNTLTNQEGGTDPEEFRFAAVVDRVHTTATVWLGSTLACAQCHNHKFDPFSQRDYWRFFAIFNSSADTGNSPQPLLRTGPLEQVAELEELERTIPEREAQAEQALGRLTAQLAPALRGSASQGLTVQVSDSLGAHVQGEDPVNASMQSVHRMEPGRIAALRVRIDPTRAQNRNWALGELRVLRAGTPLKLRALFATREQENGDFRLVNALDGDRNTAWAVGAGRAPHVHDAWLALDAPLELTQAEEWTLELDCLTVWQHHNVVEWSLARSETAPENPLASLLTDQRRLDELRASLPMTMVMEELAEPRVTHRHEKGAYLSPAEPVTPGTPAILPPLPGDVPANRLSLARWLVARENPLTARVAVNRVWEQLFGRGLVATSEDFGTRGDAPTHPELLDTLAVDWMEDGWSYRRLLRRLVLSATYRQGVNISPAAQELDPTNRLLSRSPRARLPIEILRDQALALSGTLDARVGGPSVFPFQPEGVWNLVYSGDAWVRSEQGNDRRRGLYTFWKRSSHYATFQLFDAPSREQICTRRSGSNTPLQALALLNDPAFTDCARALAAQIDAAGTQAAREAIAQFERALARRATESERRALEELHRRRGSFAVANVILNLDELLCRP